MRLLSFDIFDTTLIRACGAAEGVFYLLAYRLFPDNPPLRSSFFVWRKGAESVACDKFKSQNVTLEQIYSILDEAYCVARTRVEIMAVEIDVEREQLSANPAIVDVIQRERELGAKICFISDMYLSSLVLRGLLSDLAIANGDDEIFVSCEYGCRKSDGGLYDVVRERYHPQKWQHYGDNRVSDIKIAKSKKICAKYVDTLYTDVESRVLRRCKRLRSAHEVAIFVGLLRHSRIMNGGGGYAEIAADFLSTLYIPFVRSLINRALVDNIRKIYFLNRDSYIFMKIAQSIYPQLEFRYIYLSRRSLILPYLYRRGADDFLSVMDGGTIVKRSVESLLKYLSITEDDLVTHRISFRYKRVRNRADQEDFLSKIFSSSITEVVQSRAREQRDLLLRYFEQEGLLTSDQRLLVDVGWLGTTRLMINAILRLEGYRDVTFYYYGVRRDAIGAVAGRYYTYYLPDIPPPHVVPLIEQYFSSSPYSTTLGYEEHGDEVRPILNGDVDDVTREITRINVDVAVGVSSQIIAYPYLRWDQILPICEELFFSDLANQECRIDLEPFVRCSGFDANSGGQKIRIVGRFSFGELFRYALLGENITVLDRYSLQYTYRGFVVNTISAIHSFTNGVRTKIYRAMHKIGSR